MEYQNNCSQRLHLAKGEKNIYVDIPDILLHQIEGIRFLYKQFTKKKTGVILNDPTGSGKTHQIVLFLNAIKGLLNRKPILILCGAHETEHWMTHFQDLTDFGSGVLLEPPNLNTKRMLVCVDTKSNLASLVSHHWGIVVIDDNSAVNEVLRKGFKTDFKIWMTSVDMKRNLEVFWSIYGWLCPKEKEVVQKIISKEENKLAKLILIDAVMEDVALRRVTGLTPFKRQTKAAATEIKLNRKNKDVTGTKTKRTKTNSNIENPLTSKKVVPTVLDNVGKTSRSDDANANIKRKGDDQSRQEPMKIAENIVLQFSEPENKDEESSDLNIPISMSLNNQLEYVEDNKSTVANDVAQVTTDIQIDNETSGTVTKQDTSVEDEQKAFKKSNRLNDSKVIDSANEKAVLNAENVGKKNATSIHKNIEETMREMEEKALKKFKGSFLDSIF